MTYEGQGASFHYTEKEWHEDLVLILTTSTEAVGMRIKWEL